MTSVYLPLAKSLDFCRKYLYNLTTKFDEKQRRKITERYAVRNKRTIGTSGILSNSITPKSTISLIVDSKLNLLQPRRLSFELASGEIAPFGMLLLYFLESKRTNYEVILINFALFSVCLVCLRGFVVLFPV